jgi:signal transduction histidine kinase
MAFYALSLLVTAATVVWLWRQERKYGRFLSALYGLLIFNVLQLGLTFFDFGDADWLPAFLQLLAWGGLLWGMAVNWQMGAAVLAGLFVFSLLPFWRDLVLWGFVTVVPLTAVIMARAKATNNLPIIAPSAPAAFLRPVSIVGMITPEMIASQRPILECLTDGVIFSGQEGLVEYANQAASAILRLAPTEMVEHPVTDILASVPMLGTVTNDLNHFELNGRVIQGHMSIVYNQKGVAQGTVAILRDITEKHYAEKARDDFLTTISHELRTPLTAIKGYVELFESGVGGDITPNQRMFLSTIQRNVNRMVQLINSLIFASTIKSGRLEYGSGQTDLAQLIDQLAREWQTKAAQSGQQIITTIDERLPAIQADPMHVETILQELLRNAVQYNQHGGKIQVKALLELGEVREQQFVVVSIRDEGIGIDPKDQNHVFESFYRPDNHEKQVRAGGIGMGLPIVKALVEAYNGRIWFESHLQQGSTFTFILPIQRATPATDLFFPENKSEPLAA